jgi:O-antigen/teichoic acid export membrane protein
MQKRFLKNLALILFLNLLIKPFWIFGIDLTVQNQVGDETYGFFLSMYSFSLLFYILLDLGITNFNNRNIAQNNHLLSKHFSGIATLKLFLGFVYGIVVFITGIIFGYGKEQLTMLIWLVMNQFLMSFLLYLRSNISGLMLFTTDSLLSVLDRVLMIILCGFLLWSGFFPHPIQISWFVYAQTVSYTLAVLLALIIVLTHTGKIKLSFNFTFSLAILRQSLPYAILVLLMSIYNRLEPVLLERLLDGNIGLQQTGIYGRAFRLFDAGNNISLLFAALLLPMFSSLLKKGEPLIHLVKLSFTIIITMSLGVAIISIIFGDNLLSLLFHSKEINNIEFDSSINSSLAVFRVLMSSFVAVSATYIFGTLLTANGSLKLLNITALCGVVLNLVLNLILIPRYQALGASITSLSVQLFMAVLQFFLARKILKIRFGFTYWLQLILYVVTLTFTAISLKTAPMSWIYQLLITAGMAAIYVFVLRLLSFKHLKLMILEFKASTNNRL